MRKSSRSAFTLVEMMTVLVIIIILMGLVIKVAGYVTRKGNLARAQGEIRMLEAGCENYKGDNGGYPRDLPADGASVTDALSPKTNVDPSDAAYSKASLFLYRELTGDKTGTAGKPDGVPDDGEKRYLKEMDPRILGGVRNSSKVITEVKFFQDPFAFPYGYSTAAAKAEEDFQRSLRLNPSATRPTGAAMPGYNPGSFDLWSTAGGMTAADVPKWEKNW